MTLTSLLPTLRHSIPTPFDRDQWPARTTPTIDDLVVAGVSVLRYVALCGTPSTITGPALLPLSGGVASGVDTTTILTTTVVAVDEGTAGPVLLVDAVLTAMPALWRESRMIGRVSSAPDHRFAIRDAVGADLNGVAVVLPHDVRSGDVIAVPCPGAHTVGEVR